MKVMGIDQSYTGCGVVVLDDGKLVSASVSTSDPTADIYDRAWEQGQFILELIRSHDPDRIFIEGLAFSKKGNRTRDLAGLLWTIINTVRHLGKKTITTITPLQVKKHAIGKGKAEKSEMIEALPVDVAAAFDKIVTTKKLKSDLADAYFIASAGAASLT